ncbi:uncharacterized protein [Watersipora subatra]|uniref:uncharacterized protein n=1 Tax=Watersipora subatra TaxID=2589382 RepID=UPI00355BB14E
MKTYFRANRYPQEISRPVRHISDSNNNNNSKNISTQATDKETKAPLRQCLCGELSSLCVISRSIDVSSARQSYFSRNLLERMKSIGNQCFPVYATEILATDYKGWLSVDEEHRYYAAIADCLFCLFEAEDSSVSCMSLNLNGCQSQSTDSSHYQNALTIQTQDDVLYFYTSSAQSQQEWIKWLNVGAQLPFENLVMQSRQSETCEKDTQTEATLLKLVKEQGHADSTDLAGKVLLVQWFLCNYYDSHDILESLDGYVKATMREGLGALRKPANDRPRSQSVFVDNESARRHVSKYASLRPSSSYDLTLDMGTSRRFPSTKELMQELGFTTVSVFNDSRLPERHKFSLPADTSQPQYFENLIFKNPLSKSASLEEKEPSSWRRKLVRRASSLFMSKSGKFNLSKKSNTEIANDSTEEPMQGNAVTVRRTESGANGSDLQTVDMAELCEVQGYLLFKKPLKWVSYYCCVYNGTFSCFKDQRSSYPEIQCLLSDCQVIPVAMKKPFVFKLVCSTKSACFAAVSDADLYSWYNIFNNYVKGALDLPMIEKTSADGASLHSDECDGRRETDSKMEVRGSSADKNTDKQVKPRKISLGKRRPPAPPQRTATSQAIVMRSASESDEQPFKYTRRMMPKKSLSQFYCRSMDDIPGMGSSNSSSGDEEVSTEVSRSRPRRTHEERKRVLLDKMIKEKLRIERALEQQKRKEDEEEETEVVVNMTQLQQRRVSAQLKYDFLERKLNDKKEDKSRYSGLFQKSGKSEKAGKPLQTTAADSIDSNHHIRQQMEELKHKLDSLDKGLTETRSKHTTSMNKILNNSPAALTSAAPPPSPGNSLSQHKLRGLESIIETLETPKHQSPTVSLLPQFSGLNNCSRCLQSTANEEKSPLLEIRAETMAVINEFETMTKNLLSKTPNINANTNYKC